MFKLRYFILLLGLLLFGTLFIFRSGTDEAPVRVVDESLVVSDEHRPEYLISESAKMSDGGAEMKEEMGATVNKMIDGLNSKGSYRAFYEMALRNPRKGGIFYASKVISICSMVRNHTNFGGEVQTPYHSGMDGRVYQAMSLAADEFRARCSMFTSEELSEDYLDEIRNSENSKRDPLILVSRALGENEDYEDIEMRKKIVDEVVRLGDPLLISELGMRLLLIRHPETGRASFKYGGEYYSINSDIDVGFALYMLPCSLGMKCDRDEFDVALKCASGVGCYDGRVEYVKTVMADGGRDVDGTMRLLDDMAEAVRTKDKTRFLN